MGYNSNDATETDIEALGKQVKTSPIVFNQHVSFLRFVIADQNIVNFLA